jgi:hypothetical protein
MGHSSTRAARVYMHVRRERDKEIAATLDRMAKRHLKRAAMRCNDQLPAARSGTPGTRSEERLPMISGLPAQPCRWPGNTCLERVTRIELALSAWESEATRPSSCLSCVFLCPLVAVTGL